jgi:hypothetical protein
MTVLTMRYVRGNFVVTGVSIRDGGPPTIDFASSLAHSMQGSTIGLNVRLSVAIETGNFQIGKPTALDLSSFCRLCFASFHDVP